MMAAVACGTCGTVVAPNAPGCPRCGRPAVLACPRCQGTVSIRAAFCGVCGLPIVPPGQVSPGNAPMPPQAAPTIPAERVLGAIPNARSKSGMFHSDVYVLVVTDRRLICANVTSDLMKEVVEHARAEAKAEGKGFFGQWGAQLGASIWLGRRYLEMAPDAIAAETPGTWWVGPDQVRRIHVERKTREAKDVRGMDVDYLKITLEAASGTTTFETDREDPNRDEARALLGQVFGAVVR